MIVVGSTRAAVVAVVTVYWPPGSEVAVEDPGYRVVQRVPAAGLQLRHVLVDAQGINIACLSQGKRRCVGAYLTLAPQ